MTGMAQDLAQTGPAPHVMEYAEKWHRSRMELPQTINLAAGKTKDNELDT